MDSATDGEEMRVLDYNLRQKYDVHYHPPRLKPAKEFLNPVRINNSYTDVSKIGVSILLCPRCQRSNHALRIGF